MIFLGSGQALHIQRLGRFDETLKCSPDSLCDLGEHEGGSALWSAALPPRYGGITLRDKQRLISQSIHYSKQGGIALRTSVFRETLGLQDLFFKTEKKPTF